MEFLVDVIQKQVLAVIHKLGLQQLGIDQLGPDQPASFVKVPRAVFNPAPFEACTAWQSLLSKMVLLVASCLFSVLSTILLSVRRGRGVSDALRIRKCRQERLR